MSESVRANSNVTVLRALYSEPVDNTGLESAGMQGYEGYYYLGHDSLWGYTGYLYRSFSESFQGNMTRYVWSKGTTKSAIHAAIATVTAFTVTGALPVILAALTALLLWDDFATLLYEQSAKVDVWRVTHNYRVRVNGKQTFSTYRIRDYWWIKNETTGEGRYEFKTFIDGFSPANPEIIRFGIEKYVNPFLKLSDSVLKIM